MEAGNARTAAASGALITQAILLPRLLPNRPEICGRITFCRLAQSEEK